MNKNLKYTRLDYTPNAGPCPLSERILISVILSSIEEPRWLFTRYDEERKSKWGYVGLVYQ